MNTDPFEQTNIALKSAAALVDQSRDEIARLAKERDQLKQQLAQLRQEYDRYTEQQTDLTQREHKRHVEIKERLEADAAAMKWAIINGINYVRPVDYFHHHFPQTDGHIPLRKWLEQLEQSTTTTAGRSLLERLESLRKLLFYVAYHRLPLSDTTLFDDLDLERQKQIHKALEGKQ